MRINRYLSICAVASRRKADELIIQGRVKINGKVINTPGVLIDPVSDKITVDDIKITPKKKVYYKVYKPTGVITTTSDEMGRFSVVHLLDNNELGVFPVGRLDKDSEGLLFMTNDGDFANALSHPSRKIEKIYEVTTNKKLEDGQLDKLRKGIKLREGKTLACDITVVKSSSKGMELLFVLKQGLNRQIRRMIKSVGADVTFLKRTFIGPVGLSGMNPGDVRKLSNDELNALKKNIKP